MTANDFRAALAALSLSQLAAARLFAQNPRTVRRWAEGSQDLPRAVSIALGLMIKHKENPADWQLAEPARSAATAAPPAAD